MHIQNYKKIISGGILSLVFFSFLVFFVSIFEATGTEVIIDASVITTNTRHIGADPTIVFTDDNTGYAFFVDSGGDVRYAKTTNGGTSWGTPVIVDAQTDALGVAVWYDRWTPADTTGNLIHVLTWDSGSSDLWYETINTASADAQSGSIAITSAPGPALTNTLTVGTVAGSITKGDNGIIYAGIVDSSASYVLRCSTTCSTASNWTQTATPTFANSDNDWLMLRPFSSNDIMAIWWDSSADDILSKIYEDGAGTWPGSWTTVDLNADENATYDAAFGAFTHPTTYDVYLAYVEDASVLGPADDDIETWVYDTSWVKEAEAITNDTFRGITYVNLALDINTDDVYLTYAVAEDPSYALTQSIFYKISTDAMNTWSSEYGPLNTISDLFFGLRTNYLSSERLYTTWYYDFGDDIAGETLANIAPSVEQIYAGTSGSQVDELNPNTINNYSGGAFTFIRSAGTANITSIKISETGTLNSNSHVSNLELYYETAVTCTYDGTETLFGSSATFNASDEATITGTMAVGTSQVCMYLIFDIAENGFGTLEFEIENPRNDIIVSAGEIFSQSRVTLFEPTNVRQIDMIDPVTIDATVSTSSIEHNGGQSTVVFTDDLTGYAFYIDSLGTAVYSKTTDGGVTWGAPVTVDPQTDAGGVAVWYDRWTPADTTGNLIHVLTWDPSADDLWYETINTASADAQSGSIAITSTPGPVLANTLDAGGNAGSITKGDNGIIYAGIIDNTTSYVLRCSTTCTTASNWSQTSTPTFAASDSDWLLLVPYTNNDIMAIWWDSSADDILTKVYEDAGNTWPGSWTTVDLTADENVNFDTNFTAVTNPNNYNVYLAYVEDESFMGDLNGDIETWLYNGTWTKTAEVLTNETRGIAGLTMSYNVPDDKIYVAYATVNDLANYRSMSVNYKVSSDAMTTWSSEKGSLTATSERIVYGLRSNVYNSNRIYATWIGAAADDIFGATIKDIHEMTQKVYRFFNNLNSTDVGTALASQNTPAALSTTGQAFRLRLLGQVTSSGLGAEQEFFKLQFVGKGTGTCAAPTGGTPSTYTDVTASTVIAFNNNASPADGASITANANDPTDGGNTIINQTYEESNPFAPSSAIAVTQNGKWDFSLIDNGAPANTTYCFRIVEYDNEAIFSYSQYPEITTASTGSPNLTQSHYRWRNDDGSEVSATFTVSEDTILNDLPKNTPKRLRFLVSNEGTATSGSVLYRIEVSQPNPTSCSLATYTRLDSDTHWDTVLSSNFTDGDSTTNVASGLTDENTTFVSGQIKETNDTTAGITLSTTEFTEIEYSIQATSAATNGAEYCFRLTNAGSALDTYTNYARVTIQNDSISFSISDNTIGFGTLSATDDRFATGDLSGSSSETIAHTLSAATTASGGYTIQVFGPTLTNLLNTISAIGGTAMPSVTGTEQFGLRFTASGGLGAVSSPYNNATQYAYDGITIPDVIASAGSGDNVTTNYSAYYMCNISSITEAGEYSTTLNYIITANF